MSETASAEAPVSTRTITVQVMGGQSESVPFVEGERVGYYLDQAGMSAGPRRAINMGGRSVRRRTPVREPGATITVAKAASNG